MRRAILSHCIELARVVAEKGGLEPRDLHPRGYKFHAALGIVPSGELELLNRELALKWLPVLVENEYLLPAQLLLSAPNVVAAEVPE